MKVYTVTEEALRKVIEKALYDSGPIRDGDLDLYVQEVVNASNETCQKTCQYDEEGEGYTAPACQIALYHVEGCQYFH
jgi:hypothetical protein